MKQQFLFLVMAAAVLPSCSANSSQGTAPLIAGQSAIPAASAGTGWNGRATTAVSPSTAQPPRKSQNFLYIADYKSSTILRLHGRKYRDDGFISTGISGPVSVFLDNKANLYVANQAGQNVTVYAPGASAPSYTYTGGMQSPDVVTADARGNFFEGDGNGTVNEYYQGINSPVATCVPGVHVYGIAVDAAGDVFVDVDTKFYNELIEYTPSSFGTCSRTVLGTGFNGGAMAIDAKGTLLLCDGGVVDVIPPPYSTVTGTLGSGFNVLSSITLNKANTEAFVADIGNNTVTVLSYPGGTNLTVLSVDQPYGAVAWPNAVY